MMLVERMGLPAAFGLLLAAGLSVPSLAQTDPPGSAGRPGVPAVLMKSTAEVRSKLVGRTISRMGRSGTAEFVRLTRDGKGLLWGPGEKAARSVTWSVKTGAQVGMGVPADLYFLCLMMSPSADATRGRESCQQAELWRLVEEEPPPRG